MSPADLPAAHALSLAVGWPHRVEDWQFALALGDGIVATRDGELAGTAMWWLFDPGVGRIGMVIVNPKLQRAGLGRILMEAGLQRLNDRTVLLTATPAGEPLYRSLGFMARGRVMQHQGIARSEPQERLPAAQRLRAASAADVFEMHSLDFRATGLNRSHVLSVLLEQGHIVVLERDGEIMGFSVCRRFGRGMVIGPVVASDAGASKRLIAHWVGQLNGTLVRIDIPENAAMSAWLAGLGLKQVDTVLPMVRGTSPVSAGTASSFALVNQALG